MAVEGLEDKLKENDNLIHTHNVQQRGAPPGHGYMGTGILVSIHCVRQARSLSDMYGHMNVWKGETNVHVVLSKYRLGTLVGRLHFIVG